MHWPRFQSGHKSLSWIDLPVLVSTCCPVERSGRGCQAGCHPCASWQRACRAKRVGRTGSRPRLPQGQSATRLPCDSHRSAAWPHPKGSLLRRGRGQPSAFPDHGPETKKWFGQGSPETCEPARLQRSGRQGWQSCRIRRSSAQASAWSPSQQCLPTPMN